MEDALIDYRLLNQTNSTGYDEDVNKAVENVQKTVRNLNTKLSVFLYINTFLISVLTPANKDTSFIRIAFFSVTHQITGYSLLSFKNKSISHQWHCVMLKIIK